MKKWIKEENACGTGATMNVGQGEQYAIPFAFKKKKKRKLRENSVSYTPEQIEKYIKEYEGLEKNLMYDFKRKVNSVMAITVDELMEPDGRVKKVISELEELTSKWKKIYEKFDDIRDMDENLPKELDEKLRVISAKAFNYMHGVDDVKMFIEELSEVFQDYEDKQPQMHKRLQNIAKTVNMKDKISEEKFIKLVDQLILQEISYGQFIKTTGKRTGNEHINRALKEVRKRVSEINRIVEFTSRLKNDLRESNSLKEMKSTQNALDKISEMLNLLNNNVKNLIK